MDSTKRTSLVFIATAALVMALAASPISDAGAVKNPASTAEQSKEDAGKTPDKAARLEAVAENCANIKHALTQLQHADSRTRTYLGTSYETIAGRFITPLNLRLERNNRSSSQLLSVQSEFITAQSDFRLAYTEYMRDLESLIAIDCSVEPENFYQHLETTRTKRAALQSIVQKLNTLAGKQYQAVADLEKNL